MYFCVQQFFFVFINLMRQLQSCWRQTHMGPKQPWWHGHPAELPSCCSPGCSDFYPSKRGLWCLFWGEHSPVICHCNSVLHCGKADHRRPWRLCCTWRSFPHKPARGVVENGTLVKPRFLYIRLTCLRMNSN